MNNQLKKNIQSGAVILTDLETDDCIAIEMVLHQLTNMIITTYENNKVFEKPIDVLIVTGEGNIDKTGLAGALVNSILDPILQQIFNGNNKTFDTYINVQIVQGSMNKKEYPVKALKSYGNMEFKYNIQKDACEIITEFLIENKNAIIIALKPLRDLMKCYKNGFNDFHSAPLFLP